MKMGDVLRSLFFFLLVPLGVLTVFALPIAKTKFFEKLRTAIDRRNSWAGYLLKCVFCLCGWSSLAVTALYSSPFLEWLLPHPRFDFPPLVSGLITVFDFGLRWGILWGIAVTYYRALWPFLEKTAPKWRIPRAKPYFTKAMGIAMRARWNKIFPAPVMYPEIYDVVIVGGGVTGNGNAYALTFLKGLGRALLIEKNEDVALVNSNTASNAQTLHGGDTETNMPLEKALRMRDAEHLLSAFLDRFGSGAYHKLFKMALGVGRSEVEILRSRFAMLRSHYPTLELLDCDEIKRIVPALLEGRNPEEPVAALYRANGRAVDYHKAAKCLKHEAEKSGKIEFILSTKTKRIVRKGGMYEVHTDRGIYRSRTVLVAAGPYSLLFAHALGYAGEYTVLPVAGNFYRTKATSFDGKVYAVQDPMFPFAEVHIDHAIDNHDEMRIGPTADMVPLFERHHWRTMYDFLRSGIITPRGAVAILKIFCNRKVLKFAGRNVIFKLPYIGKRYFARFARKLVPMLTHRALRFASGEGGIRPQLVNMREGRLEMGTGKILGKDIIFDITPSPGASDCLRNAIANAKRVADFLGEGHAFDKERFTKELPDTAEALERLT